MHIPGVFIELVLFVVSKRSPLVDAGECDLPDAWIAVVPLLAAGEDHETDLERWHLPNVTTSTVKKSVAATVSQCAVCSFDKKANVSTG